MLRKCLPLIILLGASAVAQKTCLDVAEEPHHSLIFQNNAVRIFSLQLSRFESTAEHCHAHAYVSFSLTEGRTSTAVRGESPISREYYPGVASGPELSRATLPRTVKNEAATSYRAIEVESTREVAYQPPLPRAAYTSGDDFPADLGDVKPSWSVSFTRGAITATKYRVAAGDSIVLSEPDHLLISLSDLKLARADGSELELSNGEWRVLAGGAPIKLTNAGKQPAMLIAVEF